MKAVYHEVLPAILNQIADTNGDICLPRTSLANYASQFPCRSLPFRFRRAPLAGSLDKGHWPPSEGATCTYRLPVIDDLNGGILGEEPRPTAY